MFEAVDPGTRCAGWALWDQRLVACGLVRSKRKSLGNRANDLSRQLQPVDLVVVEIPRAYPKNRKLSPNDLIDLAIVAGACARVGKESKLVLPVEWKGQTPKDICHKRVMSRLSREELLIVKAGVEGVPKSLRHNVYDAVGIARWHFTGEKL